MPVFSLQLHADTDEVDYEQVQTLADEHQPKMIVAGFLLPRHGLAARYIVWRCLSCIIKYGSYMIAVLA
jgi:glycine/serine hydroxymethyltransferase